MQRPPKTIFWCILAGLVLLLAAVPALAQQITKPKGVPQSDRGQAHEPADHRHAGFAGRDHDDQRRPAPAA